MLWKLALGSTRAQRHFKTHLPRFHLTPSNMHKGEKVCLEFRELLKCVSYSSFAVRRLAQIRFVV